MAIQVFTHYEPSVNRYWIDLRAVWSTSILNSGVGIHKMTPTKPTARQLRQWKKELNSIVLNCLNQAVAAVLSV